MKQTNFLIPTRKEHGGALSVQTRRSRRPLSTKQPIHLTLKSDFAYGRRSLLKHQTLINHIGKKFARRFGVTIYRQSICGNHLHLLVRGVDRFGLQNFFRVFAGHIAQQILSTAPITDAERSKNSGGARTFTAQHQAEVTKRRPENTPKPLKKSLQPCKKNQRKFWALLTYTRVITWGKEFTGVSRYILQNTLETLNLIAYQPRQRKETSARKFSTA